MEVKKSAIITYATYSLFSGTISFLKQYLWSSDIVQNPNFCAYVAINSSIININDPIIKITLNKYFFSFS